MNTKTKTKSTPKLTKNKSKGSRFLLWCMPQALDVNMNDAVSVKQGVVLPRVFPAAASLCGDNDVGDENICVKEKSDLQNMKKKEKKMKKKGNHRTLLGILKAVFFETSVACKFRKRKTRQKKSQVNGNENSKKKELSEVDKNGRVVSNASSSSSLIASSSAFSSSFSSKSSSDTNKSFRLGSTIERRQNGNIVQVQKQHGKGCYGPHVGLCFILISLLILITWGKLCAIFCTSTWLFFGARRRISNQSSESVPRRLDLEEHKKKIILEELLKRGHSRCL